LIGVVSRPEQASIVEEFFELFKTPWEPYRHGRRYEVVLVATDRVPEANAKLLLVYSSNSTTIDERNATPVKTRQRGASVRFRDTAVPIYGSLVTFEGANSSAGVLETTSGSAAGVEFRSSCGRSIRLGYDLFSEVELLLSTGQPVESAYTPTLDMHVTMLREWILSTGVPLLEIPPVPGGYRFAVCLTHDIDFVGIRRHKFDHSMWGFVYRSTVGAVRDLLRRRLSVRNACRVWRALASLPIVYLGWAKDFWEPFEWYLRAEKNLPATYFLIPFKGRAGDRVAGRHRSRRATSYDVGDVREWALRLVEEHCEVGVHGIDAWHSVDKGRDELARIAAVTGQTSVGVRMHWLLNDSRTPSVLEAAGYAYDSTGGYNETVGYRHGTGQVFRPLGAESLLELPLHIQDGALFYKQRLDLSERDAEERCGALIDHSRELGGVLTILWHDRSHAPERLWGDFYERLVHRLRSAAGWFGSARDVVDWFRKRRAVRFESVETGAGVLSLPRYRGGEIDPPLIVRVHGGSVEVDGRGTPPEATPEYVDVPWNGMTPLSDSLFAAAARYSRSRDCLQSA
jgi:hypothetical protein